MSKRSVQTLILIVDNEFGVLTRISALVRREGWNIKSLVAAETINPALSRLTLSVECIDSTLPRVSERLGRLACVRGITVYSADTHFGREFLMATVDGDTAAAARAAEDAGARVVESSGGKLTLEWVGAPGQAEGLLAALKPFGIVDVARSGIVTLERPAKEEGQ